MRRPIRPTHSLRQIFVWPLVIGLVMLIGLVAALVGDGVWDRLSWAALSLPVIAAGWFGARPGTALKGPGRRESGRQESTCTRSSMSASTHPNTM